MITGRIPVPRLCVWTVNDEDQMRAWFDRGVGYLTTDRPDLALRARGPVVVSHPTRELVHDHASS